MNNNFILPGRERPSTHTSGHACWPQTSLLAPQTPTSLARTPPLVPRRPPRGLRQVISLSQFSQKKTITHHFNLPIYVIILKN